tara:strand:- start:129 stop:422 length:294 start_codon:yes stop_codon:yes gene_type:complete
MKKYSHIFEISFEVISEEPDWLKCLRNEKDKVISALSKKVQTVFDTDDYNEEITGVETNEVSPKATITAEELAEEIATAVEMGLTDTIKQRKKLDEA